MYDEFQAFTDGYWKGFWLGLVVGLFTMLCIFTIAGLWITS